MSRTRLSPEQRREQLLDLGVQLIADRPLDELSIDLLAEQAGVSRGLLYHYFGGKQEFLLAVLRRMADDLYAATAPVDHPDMAERLRVSLQNYVGFVRDHPASYRSFVAAALGGSHPDVRAVYEEARSALTDRIFDSASAEELAVFGIVDTAATRLFARGWASMVEDVMLRWLEDPRGITEEELIGSMTLSLGGVLAVVALSS
ncbi:TetR family transcriptional regulator [Nocardioides phosphati]|uniref:TetR family transcriptional regulator n=1 Tax=Nocardioides phosphati TaxID=1867775 RepID=A0ABQ2NB73_9ACTN|nr:TetR/AcrR family transcriptional regulator [Nocardioides phosphati]GGO89962.1 TetR family transcriptional regulator [Nocardioides phosphati]